MVNPQVVTVSRATFSRLTKFVSGSQFRLGFKRLELQWPSRLGVGWKFCAECRSACYSICFISFPVTSELMLTVDCWPREQSIVNSELEFTIPMLTDWISMAIPTKVASCKLVMIKIATVGWKRVLLCPQNINNINFSRRTIICQPGQQSVNADK